MVAVEDFILMSRQPTSNENMCRVAAMVFFFPSTGAREPTDENTDR